MRNFSVLKMTGIDTLNDTFFARPHTIYLYIYAPNKLNKSIVLMKHSKVSPL